MNDEGIRAKVLTRTLDVLRAMKARYKIIMPDGAEYGDLVVVPERDRKRRSPDYPRGEMKAYWFPMIARAKIGDVVVIPQDKFEIESLRGAIASWAKKHWGDGSVITSTDRKNGVVEVMIVTRLDTDPVEEETLDDLIQSWGAV